MLGALAALAWQQSTPGKLGRQGWLAWLAGLEAEELAGLVSWAGGWRLKKKKKKTKTKIEASYSIVWKNPDF